MSIAFDFATCAAIKLQHFALVPKLELENEFKNTGWKAGATIF